MTRAHCRGRLDHASHILPYSLGGATCDANLEPFSGLLNEAMGDNSLPGMAAHKGAECAEGAILASCWIHGVALTNEDKARIREVARKTTEDGKEYMEAALKGNLSRQEELLPLYFRWSGQRNSEDRNRDYQYDDDVRWFFCDLVTRLLSARDKRERERARCNFRKSFCLHIVSAYRNFISIQMCLVKQSRYTLASKKWNTWSQHGM